MINWSSIFKYQNIYFFQTVTILNKFFFEITQRAQRIDILDKIIVCLLFYQKNDEVRYVIHTCEHSHEDCVSRGRNTL